MSKKSRSPYGVHPGVLMVQNWVTTLPEKTGRSLDQWIELIRSEGPPTVAERELWLKREHGLGTSTAGWLAERAEGAHTWDENPDTYLTSIPNIVDEQYAGAKEALRPIYEELLHFAIGLGEDVKACPCKTIVPLYRKHVFAELKPSTRTRIDLGLAIKDTPLSGRLIDTGGLKKKDRITRRIPISSLEEIDDEVRGWMKWAYEMDV